MYKKIIHTALLIFMIQANAFSQTMNVTSKNITDNNTEEKYYIKAEYPQVDFGPDALMGVRGIAGDINNSLDSIVNSIIVKFKKDVSELSDIKDLNADSELSIDGTGWVNNGSLLCTRLVTFSYIKGMAHPMTMITTYNYTANDEGPLSFSSLFRSDKEYLNYISSLSIKELSAKLLTDKDANFSDMIIDGASADEKNFSNWSVRNDSLNLIFNPYQVAPYVYGIQEISISLSGELLEYLDPKGPLEFLFR